MGKMCPSQKTSKLGGPSVPERASAGHSNPLTAVCWAKSPKYGSISKQHTFLFPERPWRWMGNGSLLSLLQRVSVSSAVFGRELYPLPRERDVG